MVVLYLAGGEIRTVELAPGHTHLEAPAGAVLRIPHQSNKYGMLYCRTLP